MLYNAYTFSFKNVICLTNNLSFSPSLYIHSTFGVRTSALSAEWEPADGSKWVEQDFEAQINKLEKEAEERLDAKIKELEANIETVGKP